MPFSRDYLRLVLDENFEDAKRLFLGPLMAIHYAHLTMLVEQAIVPRDAARRIRAALDGVDLQAVRDTIYDGSCEDLFFHVERRIADACGADTAGSLHTARSRNDIDMTMYRMRQREWLLDLVDGTLALRQALIDAAARHTHTIFPAHTHTQPAQPTTVAHYLLAVVEQTERDTSRLFAAYVTTNRSPLGACAITGTGFPIDRQRTSELLGFDGPTGNTYGSIATIDYTLEGAAAAATALAGLGRFVQDLLLWSTVEVGYARLAEGLVQISSIMPQKRNPVALEHTRALASKALAQAQALPLAVHNTPFGDIVDTEDDLQPLVAGMFRDASRAIALAATVVAGIEFDVARMRERAAQGWVTITELADSLARDHGLPFKTAHTVASRVVAAVAGAPQASLGSIVAAAARDVSGRDLTITDADMARVLSPEYFVAVRRTHGGPAPEVVAAALSTARAKMTADEAERSRRRGALAAAESRLKEAVKQL
jgi:argininosuccinate lyase